MANTGNTQQQINYGASANDGQGDPLRTAFIKTDDNFDAIWNAGPVGSNITIVNNTVQSNNTNGNIVLRPNGVGVIQANAAIIPNATNLRDLGSANQRFRSAYVGTGGLSVDGNVTVTGNLTAGNISYTGNVFVGDLQGSVYADDSTIMVDAVDNEMFASAATFGRANVSGNVSAAYFIGNGSLLTGITGYGNANVAAYLPTYIGDIGPVDNTGNLAIGNIRVLANVRPVTGNTGSVGTFGNPWAFAHIDTIYTNNLEPISGNVQVPGNLEASTVVTGQIENIFPLFITTNGGGTWEFAGNILRGPQGGSWTSAAATSYFNSPANGFLNLTSLQNDSVVSELFMEHSFIRFLVDNGGPSKIWLMRLDGTFAVPGDILPPANITASLGNTTNYWSTLQVANINHEFPIGIQTNGGGVWEFAGNILRGPQGGSWTSAAATSYFNSPANGFLNLSSLQSGNVVSELFMEHSFIRFLVDNGGPEKTWQMNLSGEFSVPGDIIPQSNGTASLGNSTNYWANLWSSDVYAAGNITANNISAGNVFFANNISGTTATFTGDERGRNSLYAGVPLFTVLGSDVVAQFSGNVDSYTQFNFQNGNSGALASGDYVITADNGDDSTYFVNLGLGSSNHDDPDFFGDTSSPNDAYLYVVGADATGPGDTGPGNLIIGSTNGVIKFFIGNTAQANVVQTITSSGVTMTGNIAAGNVSATRLQNDANLEIRSNVAGTARTWTFDTLGDLNLPAGGNITGSGGISANNITLTGNISANTAGFALGYRDIPQVAFTGNATVAAADAGKHFYSTESTDYVLTIADNSAVSWPVGTAVTVVNRGTGNITVAQASGVSLYLAGNSSAGNRTVTTYGMVTLLNVAANVWMINGTGVS